MINLKRVEGVLLFLTILFLPTQLGKHFWPKFSLIYSLPIDYLSPAIYFWDLLIIALLLVFFLQKKSFNKVAINLFLFFLLTQTISLFSYGVQLGQGLVRLEQYLVVGLFGVYIASSGVRKEIFWGLALSIFAEGFLAFGQFIKGGTLGLWFLGERTFSLTTPGIAKFDFYGRQFLRPYATFPHPNVLAAYMMLSALILKKRLTSFLVGFIILLTVSRAALMIGIFSAFTILKKKGRFVLILVFLLLLPILYTRFSSVFNFDNLTFTRREQLSIVAYNLWFKSPIFGVGLNNFIYSASDSLLAGPSRFLQPVHNTFLLAIAETGLVGFLGWIVLLGYPILKRSNLLIWAAIIFLGMFDHYFLTLPQGYRMLFLVWGLSLAMLK